MKIWVIALVVLVLFAGCDSSGKDDDAGKRGGSGTATPFPFSDRPTPFPVQPPGLPPSATDTARYKWEDALDADNAKPRFFGTVAGFRFARQYPDGTIDEPFVSDCEGQSQRVDPLDPPVLTVTYTPPWGIWRAWPGSWPGTSLDASVCQDGRVASYYQRFSPHTGYASFDVTVMLEYRPLIANVPADRIVTVDVNHTKAIAQAPLIPEGTGPSALVWSLGEARGFIQADGLTLDELVKIAEGVRCSVC